MSNQCDPNPYVQTLSGEHCNDDDDDDDDDDDCDNDDACNDEDDDDDDALKHKTNQCWAQVSLLSFTIRIIGCQEAAVGMLRNCQAQDFHVKLSHTIPLKSTMGRKVMVACGFLGSNTCKPPPRFLTVTSQPITAVSPQECKAQNQPDVKKTKAHIITQHNSSSETTQNQEQTQHMQTEAAFTWTWLFRERENAPVICHGPCSKPSIVQRAGVHGLTENY